MKYSEEFKKTPEYKNILESNKKWYEQNKQKRKEQMKEYINRNKDAQKEYKKSYYENNKEKVKAKTKKYKSMHKEESIKYNKEYYKKTKWKRLEKMREYYKEYWKNMSPEKKKKYWKNKNAWEKQKKISDPKYAMKKRLRLRVWQAFNGIRKKRSDELGIHYDKIVEHLNKTIPSDFKDNPSKYEIDHIIPLDSFDFDKEENILKAFSPENHQWLTSSENALKKDLSPEEWCLKKNKLDTTKKDE